MIDDRHLAAGGADMPLLAIVDRRCRERGKSEWDTMMAVEGRASPFSIRSMGRGPMTGPYRRWPTLPIAIIGSSGRLPDRAGIARTQRPPGRLAHAHHRAAARGTGQHYS
jgi:hypothetical protein